MFCIHLHVLAVAIGVLSFVFPFRGLYRKARAMVVGSIRDNFDNVFGSLNGDGKRQAAGDDGPPSKKQRSEVQGDREELRVYETMPPQMLNAYGMAAFTQMDRQKVWEDLNKPLKTGAKYMTELCSNKEERRCVGLNRMLQPLVEYLKYQKTDSVREQNKFILKDEIYT